MNIDLPLAVVFVVAVVTTVVMFVRQFDNHLEARRDAKRRNQAHPWR